MSVTYETAMRMQSDLQMQSEANTRLLNSEQDSGYGTIDVLTDGTVENTESGPLTSFLFVFKKMSKIAIPMGLSFTFSFEVFLAVLLLQYLSESEEDTAAASLVSTTMNFVSTLAISPLFAASIDLTKKLGEWREERETESEHEYIAARSIQALCTAPDKALKKALKKEKIEIVNVNTMLMGTALTLPAVSALYYSNFILTSVFHQDSVVARSAQQFLRPYAFAIPGLVARITFEQVIFSFGQAKAAMCMALASFSVGACLSILLGFGKLGFPEMRQEGVALGFAVESYITALSYGLFVMFSKESKKFNFYNFSIDRIKRNLDNLLDIIRMGMMINFTVAIELLLTLSVVVFSGWLGTEQEAAMSYCLQFIYFEYIVLAAFSFSTAQEISRELGAKNFSAAADIARYGVLTGLIYVAPLPILFAAYPKALEFISGGATEEISKTLKTLVPIMSLGIILDAIRFNLLQQSRALQDFLVPSIIAFLGLSSGILLAALLGFETPLDINGVGIGYTFGVGVTAAALGLRWNTKITEATVVDIENSAPLEPEKPSLWTSICSFFYFGGNNNAADHSNCKDMHAAEIYS